MTTPRVDQTSRAGASHAWAGAAQQGAMPVRGAADPASPGDGGAGAGDAVSRVALWRRRVLRLLRDFAIGAMLTAAVPITGSMLLTNGTRLWRGAPSSVAKLLEVQAVRAWRAPIDPSVSPMLAGRTAAALDPIPAQSVSGAYPERPRIATYQRPWKDAAIPAAFGRPGASWHGPNPLTVLAAVKAGLSREDVAYLRSIADAPLWKPYDLVASAPSVDLIGGRFELPFSDEARAYAMPSLRFASVRELAYASVSRAAYYYAIGNIAEAEAVLRRTISFGFVLIDNGTDAIDGLIGRVIVGVGQNALKDLLALTNDPRANDIARAIAPARKRDATPGGPISEVEARALLLGDASNPSMPRTIRLETLNRLASTVCTNPRDMILGPRADVKDVFAKASRDLARFPSEKAWLDLVLATPNLPVPPSALGGDRHVLGGVIVGTSTLASIIFDNPRFAYCSSIISQRF